MSTKTKKLCAALMAGVFATAATASFAQTSADTPMTHADKKKTEAQSEANEAAADANLKNAKKAQ